MQTSTVENQNQKQVVDNKNKVETTTLNLNLDLKHQISKLSENKVEQNNTTFPAFGSRSLDERASGTRHTNVGDTRLAADETTKTAISSDIKLTPNYNTNSPYKDGQVAEINIKTGLTFGLTGTATINKDDIKKGNRILLGTIQISNDRFGQDAATDNANYKNELNNDNLSYTHAMPVTFMNQSLGNIDIITHDPSELDLFFNVTRDLVAADNPTISFNNIMTLSTNAGNRYYPLRGMQPKDSYVQQIDTGKHKYTIKYDYTPLSTTDSKYVYDINNQFFGNIGPWRQVWPNDSFRSHLFVPDSDGKFDLSNLHLKNNGEYDLAIKVKSADGTNLPTPAGLFTRNSLMCEVNANGKLVLTDSDANLLWWVQWMNDYGSIADNLSAKDVLDKTPKGGARASRQADGSFIIGIKLTKEDLFNTSTAANQEQIKESMMQTGLVNLVDPQNSEKIISNTLKYYRDNPYCPYFAIGFNFENDNSKPAIWTASDVTPQNYSEYVGNVIPTHTSSDGANTGTFNAELYRNAVVNYVDDDNSGVNVSKDSIVGRKNIGTNYTINIPQGYVLATDNTDGTNYKWGADKSKITYTFQDDQKVNDENPIVIHLTHGRKDLVDSNVISETVHYQFEDGTKAADDYNAKHVVSSRIGHKDLVTGQTIWDSDWSKETFPEVTSPHINGYTADLAKIDAQNVDGTSQDIVKTVVYKANDQKIFVHYIDDDVNGQDLHTDPLVGKSNTVANYTTGDAIKGYENQGYDLVSDDTHGQAIKYDADDDHDQNYSVHLKHHISTVTDPKLLTATFDRTVTEKFPDGQTKTLTQHYVINRTGTQDQVTKKYTFANWSSAQVHEDKGDKLNGYTAVIASQNPSEIASIQDGTPVVKAEVFTNSNDAIQPVNANETVVITYNANDQKIYVHYIDDDEAGKDLHTDSLVGKTNTDANYTTGDTIKGYLDQGYDLVSDDTKGAELKYDADDAHDQIYNVHFKHHISAVTDPKLLMATFNRTVNEKLPDGQTKTLTQHYVINRTGTQDQVTKKYTFGNWSTAQVHEDKGDNLDGYTAVITNQNPGNIASIQDGTPVVKAEVFTNANDNSIQPVNANELVEIAYNANDQKATITFIDDDAQKDKQVLQTKNLVGKSNTKADYDTGADIENYLNKGFELVSDDTQGNPITFDAHDKVDQVFTVHLKHHISDVTDPRVLTATFDRVVTETLPDGKDKQITQHYVITRTGKQDQVTKKYTWGNWTTAQVYEDKGDTFEGYTPHLSGNNLDSFISLVDGTPIAKAETFTNENGKLLPKNVSEKVDITYTANPQEAAIVFYDDTADTSLQKNTVRGHYGEAIEFIPKVSDVITEYTKKGYVLVSNEFDNQKYAADDKQNVFVVHLKHGTMDVTRSKDVTETIHYVYDNNSKAHDDYVTTKKFENHGVKDLVTGETKWDTNWTPENDQFAQVNSPEIPGYTADKEKIPAQTVNADSKNLEFKVTYTKTSEYVPNDVVPEQPQADTNNQVRQPDVSEQPNTNNDSADNKPATKVKKISTKHGAKTDFGKESTVAKLSDSAVAKKQKTNYPAITTVKISEGNNKPVKVIKVQPSSEKLPKTGEKEDSSLAALGLAAVSLGSLFGLGLKKKEN